MNLSALERLTLLAIADYANDAGACWPSQVTLAQLTGLSERSIRSCLASLEANGVITRRSRSTQEGRKSDVIELNLQPAPNASSATGNSLQPAPDAPQPAPDAGNPVRETISIKKEDSRSVATATRPGEPSRFEEFWKARARRKGSYPRAIAEKEFAALVKSGVGADDLIGAMKRYATKERSMGNENTPYIPQTIKWLNQERWRDYAPAPAADAPKFLYAKFGTPQLEAWDAYYRKHKGGLPPRDRGGGSFFLTEWPPDTPPPQSVAPTATNTADLCHAVSTIAA